MSLKVKKAKIKLLLGYPFFASLVLKKPLTVDNTIETACTDGLAIWYNSDFFESLEVNEILAVLAHEVLHIAFMHHLRRNARDPEKWNYACDYAINPILLTNKFALPEGGLYNEAYKDFSAEKIYDLLPDDYKQNPTVLKMDCGNAKGVAPSEIPGGKPLMLGEIKEPNGCNQPDKLQEHLEKLRMSLTEAMQSAKMAGRMPLGLDRIIDVLNQSLMNWKEILASFLNQSISFNRNFLTPNKRFLHTGVILPGKNIVKRGQFVLAIDTSGSVSQNLLNDFAKEIIDILALSGDVLTVICCDADVASVQEIEPGSDEPIKFAGGGGTDFAPVIEYIQSNQLEPEVLIYFTDSYCSSFGKEPSYPVLWATDNPEMTTPYGEVICIN